MKHLRLLVFSLAIVALFASVIATPSYAWLNSDYANVKVPMNPVGSFMQPGWVTCKSATLSGNGYSYTASIDNQYMVWNKCNLIFKDVYVGHGLTYMVTFEYSAGFSGNKKFTAQVFVDRPVLDTYTTSTVEYQP